MTIEQLETLLKDGDLTKEQTQTCKDQINELLGHEKYKPEPIKKYALDELPAKVFIEVEEPEALNPAVKTLLSGIGGVLVVGGIIVMAVGGWYMATGPSMIIYDRIAGMTFEQKLQSYPGPIASVGGLLAMIGSLCFKALNKPEVGIPNDKLNEHLSFDLNELKDNQVLYVTQLPDSMFEIGVNEVAQPEASE